MMELVERIRKAFDADSVAEKNLALRAAYDFIAAMQPEPAGSGPVDNSEEAYALGKEDGYSAAIADVDRRTGGDGEYFASTIPGRGCPDPQAMLAGIIERFTTARAEVEREVVAWLRGQAAAGDKALLNAVEGSTLRRDLAAGVVAINRAADSIERREHRT